MRSGGCCGGASSETEQATECSLEGEGFRTRSSQPTHERPHWLSAPYSSPSVTTHDLLHGGRVDERGHPAHGHVEVHARRGRHQGEWEGRSKAHAEGARICHFLKTLFPSLFSPSLFSHSSSADSFFVCGPYGSAADLQLELLEILTPGLGRAARR